MPGASSTCAVAGTPARFRTIATGFAGISQMARDANAIVSLLQAHVSLPRATGVPSGATPRAGCTTRRAFVHPGNARRSARVTSSSMTPQTCSCPTPRTAYKENMHQTVARALLSRGILLPLYNARAPQSLPAGPSRFCTALITHQALWMLSSGVVGSIGGAVGLWSGERCIA